MEKLIERNGKISYKQAAYYIYRAAAGLLTAHKSGIIHRDVKPANILISKSGKAKITDLGVSGILSGFERKNSQSPTTSTSSGVKELNGTPAYIAPEQALQSDCIDVRSDIYSLGATFFHAITGRYPFLDKSAYGMIMKHVREPLTPPHEIVDDIPIAVSRVIEKMMAKKPEDRYPTIEHLLPDLISFFVDHSLESSSVFAAKPNFTDESAFGIDDTLNSSGSITRVLIRAAKQSLKSNSSD